MRLRYDEDHVTSKDRKLVHEVFTAARRRDPEERDGFLDHRCTGKSWLRAEVASLLATHARAGGFSGAHRSPRRSRVSSVTR